MMERDLQAIKEEVRARTDIVEIISGYTRLKRSGKNWTGLCPFHADKNPSFTVTPETQSYRCWSCGEKGDVFTFVGKKENMDFMETLEKLAKRAGVVFERRAANPELVSERERMRELNALAVKFFQDRLSKSEDAKDYLAGRGILKSTQEQFDIGFAPPDWDALFYYLQRNRADLALAAKIGLIKERQMEGTGYYDFYRNRLMFPIHDQSGSVIGFGGRAMSKEEQAKYINSPDSLIFDKSNTLYGLYFARKKLSGEIPAVFVEGYMDVVTTHQGGFTQCVATLGTAMTEGHARMLMRYNPRVIICYDADTAGIKATLRGAEVWETVAGAGAEVRVARLPEGDDPDSLLKRGETAAFQAALDHAIPRVEFQLELARKRHDLQTEEGREEALREIIPILATVRSHTVRDRYVQKMADLHPAYSLNINRAIESILADVEMYSRQSRNATSPRDRGYPLTEDANRQTLQENPPPPTYRPPNAQSWGEWNPNTRNIVPKGEGGNRGGYPNGKGGYGKGGYGRRNQPQGPASDPSPPPLIPPALNRTEKAERTLLRALFQAEWRPFILSQLHPDYLITELGRRLFDYVARTPANEDGGIDILPLLNRIESEEEPTLPESAPPNGDPEGFSDYLSELPDRVGKNSAKLSEYLREVLEESATLLSNEPLNEAAVRDCIRRLQGHREERTRREMESLLQRTDLTPEQRQALVQQYQQKMRALRGSPPEKDAA